LRHGRFFHQALKALLVALVLWAAPAKSAEVGRADVAVLIASRGAPTSAAVPTSGPTRYTQTNGSTANHASSHTLDPISISERAVSTAQANEPRAPRCPRYLSLCALLR
jgi:hypothetical protein